MPFNASGVFQRLFNWRNDRDAGIKILAERMDQETDGLVAGLNDVVQGRVNLKGPVKGVSGTAAAPAYAFTDDPDTGVYRSASGEFSITSNGVQSLRLSSDVFTYKGLEVWHAGNDGAGSGLDADQLDGQHGAFYRDAGNLDAGRVPDARLSGTYNISIAGDAGTLGGKAASDFSRLNETNQFNRTGDFSAVFTGDGEGYGRLIRLNGVAPGADAAASYHSPGIAIWHAGAKGDGTFAFNVGGGGANYGNDVAKIKNDGDIWSAKFGNLAGSSWFAQPALRRTAAASGSLNAYWNQCPAGSFVTGLWRHPTSNGIDHFEWRFAQIQRRDGVWVTMVDG